MEILHTEGVPATGDRIGVDCAHACESSVSRVLGERFHNIALVRYTRQGGGGSRDTMPLRASSGGSGRQPTMHGPHVQAMIHNSIDRYTGGVRNRMLFVEELIWQRPIELRITLLTGVERSEPTARQALARAIRDLCEGRLALGAGTTKGHGSFTGTPDDNAKAWLSAQGEAWA